MISLFTITLSPVRLDSNSPQQNVNQLSRTSPHIGSLWKGQENDYDHDLENVVVVLCVVALVDYIWRLLWSCCSGWLCMYGDCEVSALLGLLYSPELTLNTQHLTTAGHITNIVVISKHLSYDTPSHQEVGRDNRAFLVRICLNLFDISSNFSAVFNPISEDE